MRKRFNNTEEILAAIERCMAKSDELLKMAEEVDEHAKRYRDIPRYAEQLAFEKETARRLRRKSDRLVTVKLLELKKSLAAFQTATFAFMGEDISIQRPAGT